MAKGALSRVADIIRADVNDLLSRVEDPEKMVRQMILDMEDAVNESAAAVTRAVVNEKMLERQILKRQDQAAVWEANAEKAVSAGEDELARQALQQKVRVDLDVQELKTAQEEARKVTADLKQQMVQFKAKMAEARANERNLILRRKAVQQHKQMAHEPLGVSQEAFSRFEDFCQDVAREEASATVYEEVAGTQPMLDATFEKLAQKQKVEAELKALKQKMSGGEAAEDQK